MNREVGWLPRTCLPINYRWLPHSMDFKNEQPKPRLFSTTEENNINNTISTSPEVITNIKAASSSSQAIRYRLLQPTVRRVLRQTQRTPTIHLGLSLSVQAAISETRPFNIYSPPTSIPHTKFILRPCLAGMKTCQLMLKKE